MIESLFTTGKKKKERESICSHQTYLLIDKYINWKSRFNLAGGALSAHFQCMRNAGINQTQNSTLLLLENICPISLWSTGKEQKEINVPLRNQDSPNYFLVKSVFHCCASNTFNKTKKCNHSALIYLFILGLQEVFCEKIVVGFGFWGYLSRLLS